MKKVIVGLGTQRSGTTFLANILNGIKLCKPPAIKELNIWSPLKVKHLFDDLKFNDHNVNLINDRHLHLVLRDKDLLNKVLEIRKLRLLLQSDTDNYFSYFQYLLKHFNCDISYDISPSYIGLDMNTLKEIYNGFNSKKIDCKFILFIRDPILRSWSAVKKQKMKKNLTSWDRIFFKKNFREGIDNSQELEKAFIQYISHEYSIYYNNFIDVIENLKNNFNQNDYAICLYEQIGTDKFIKNLENIFNVRLSHFDFTKKINKSTDEELDDKFFENFLPIYKEVYQYCGKYYPDCKRYWRGFKFLE